jgi:hypothetical protein
VQVRRIPFAKPAVVQAERFGATGSSLDQISRDVDTQYIGSPLGARNRRVSVTAARSSTRSPDLIPSWATNSSPLARIVSAIRVQSPCSQSAWFGFICRSSRAITD